MSDNSVIQLKKNQKNTGSLFDVPNADISLLATLVEMGFDKTKSERALQQTRNAGIQQAIDWIYSHQDEDYLTPPTTNNTTTSTSPSMQPTTPPPSNTTESSSDPNPDNYLDLKNPLKLHGFSLEEKHQFAEKQRIKQQEEIRREKEAKKNDLLRLRAQMEAEKKERFKNKLNNMESTTTTVITPTPAPASSTSANKTTTSTTPATGSNNNNNSECLLQIRLTDGSTIKQTFKGTDTLHNVFEFVTKSSGQGKHSYTLLMSFPRKEFDYDRDANMTLAASSLCPRAQLIVQKIDDKGVVKKGDGVFVPPGGTRLYNDDDDDGGAPPGYPRALGGPLGGLGGPRVYNDDDDDDLAPRALGGAGRRLGRNDDDGDNYEQLLALSERIGNVDTGLTFEELAKLPITLAPASPNDSYETSQRCVVCLCDYNQGEEQCTLPCGHKFHKPCIYKYLQKKNTCPYCKASVRTNRK